MLSILLWQWGRIIVCLFEMVFKIYKGARYGDTQYSGSWIINLRLVVLHEKTVKISDG